MRLKSSEKLEQILKEQSEAEMKLLSKKNFYNKDKTQQAIALILILINSNCNKYCAVQYTYIVIYLQFCTRSLNVLKLCSLACMAYKNNNIKTFQASDC